MVVLRQQPSALHPSHIAVELDQRAIAELACLANTSTLEMTHALRALSNRTDPQPDTTKNPAVSDLSDEATHAKGTLQSHSQHISPAHDLEGQVFSDPVHPQRRFRQPRPHLMAILRTAHTALILHSENKAMSCRRAPTQAGVRRSLWAL
ncbi:hypothetical protein ACTG9Q_32255 [Actinokineospora sp. 24-640]